MATRTVLIDDISGTTDDVQPVTFTIAGKTYALDLGADSRASLLEALEPYIAAAHAERKPRAARAPRHPNNETAELRHWARANGWEVGDRGRIPQSIRDAYAAR